MRRSGILIVLAVAACDLSFGRDNGGSDASRINESILRSSSGEVELADGRRFPYAVSSERYRQWDAAQQSLDRGTAERLGDILEPLNPSEQSINRAVAFLESNGSARQGIERAGMNVRDFVMTTVALEQEMRLATGEGRAPRQDPMTEMYPYPMDTFSIIEPMQPLPPPAPYTPYTPSPIPGYDTNVTTPVRPPVRVDTLYPTPSPTPPNTPPQQPPPIIVPVQPTPAPIPTPAPVPPPDSTRPRTDTLRPTPVPPPTDTSSARRAAAPPNGTGARPQASRLR